MNLKIGLIGAGAVAYGIADAILLSGLSIKAIVSRNKSHAQRLAKRIGIKKFGTNYQLLDDCNFVITAASDISLKKIAKEVSHVAFRSNSVTMVHTSGSLTSDILQPAKSNAHADVTIASMHPMQTFLLRSTRRKKMRENTYFGIEGEKKALKNINHFVRQIKAKTILVPKSYKSLYHIGGIMASNFVVALLYEIQKLYNNLDWNEKQTLAVVLPLMQATIANVQAHGTVSSLTGPASRKDITTIRSHIKILSKKSHEIARLYRYLTDICLKITLNKS
ncbi:DUF2520 domain-containing protein [bacterium]|nr:DUF2520 domain-containing protein [bacterium]